MMEVSEDSLFQSVKEIITQSREKVFRIANSTLLLTYRQIGNRIVEDKQKGKEHAEYGKHTLKNLSRKLTLEFGKGFAFVARQQHISTAISDFYIDLVFYNYILKCFVIIDLKTGELSHQDIGQIDMYVRMYDDLKRNEGDNPTIGILLCSEKDETIVKYSVLNDRNNVFASKYLLYLPKEEELKHIIDQDRIRFELDQENNNNPN